MQLWSCGVSKEQCSASDTLHIEAGEPFLGSPKS